MLFRQDDFILTTKNELNKNVRKEYSKARMSVSHPNYFFIKIYQYNNSIKYVTIDEANKY